MRGSGNDVSARELQPVLAFRKTRRNPTSAQRRESHVKMYDPDWCDVPTVDEFTVLKADKVVLRHGLDLSGLASEQLSLIELYQRMEFLGDLLADDGRTSMIAEEAHKKYGFTLRRTMLYIGAFRRMNLELAKDPEAMFARMTSMLVHLMHRARDSETRLAAMRDLSELSLPSAAGQV